MQYLATVYCLFDQNEREVRVLDYTFSEVFTALRGATLVVIPQMLGQFEIKLLYSGMKVSVIVTSSQIQDPGLFVQLVSKLRASFQETNNPVIVS